MQKPRSKQKAFSRNYFSGGSSTSRILSLIVPIMCWIIIASCTPSADVCKRTRDVPEAECVALRAFYETTGGPDWKDARGWLENEEKFQERWSMIYRPLQSSSN
jgi:hypothetical protein